MRQFLLRDCFRTASFEMDVFLLFPSVCAFRSQTDLHNAFLFVIPLMQYLIRDRLWFCFCLRYHICFLWQCFHFTCYSFFFPSAMRFEGTPGAQSTSTQQKSSIGWPLIWKLLAQSVLFLVVLIHALFLSPHCKKYTCYKASEIQTNSGRAGGPNVALLYSKPLGNLRDYFSIQKSVRMQWHAQVILRYGFCVSINRISM